MTPQTIALLVSLATVIFAAGGFYYYVPRALKAIEDKIDKNYGTLDGKIEHNRKDSRTEINGIGNKVFLNKVDADRRYHNSSLAIMQAAPAEKESEISHLLKEN